MSEASEPPADSESAPPEGYLGAAARIRSGPAPAMIDAGYAVEVADGALLHHGFNLADLAHVLALHEQGVVPGADARALLGALLELAEMDPEHFPFDPALGDAYNSRERWLKRRVGNAAGWLAAGRARREAGRIAFRIALRGRVLRLTGAIGDFASALVDVGERHAATLMVDYTYLQAAQPTTFGHYLLSFAYPALRDAERVRAGYSWVNRSPAGVAGVAGSRLPLERSRLAELLGFDGVIQHARDAMWQTDGLVELTTAAALAVTNASNLAQDLEIYSSAEFGLVEIGDAFCRASVVMPHKRNPYSLAVIRGGAGTLAGACSGLLATQQTPSARTDNLLYAYSDVCSAVDRATDLLRLGGGVVASLEPDAQRMAHSAASGFAQVTDLTEAVCAATELDYRSAYLVVGRAVVAALEEGRGPKTLDPAALRRAAQDVLSQPLELAEDLLLDALDPRAAIATRTITGGAAPVAIAEMVDELRTAMADLRRWTDDRVAATADAEAALVTAARATARARL